MAMARVAAGSFDIKDNKLEFRAAGKPDEVSSIFERQVERLNEMAEKEELTFVSVCANQSTVFVAVNNPYGWALVFEINAIHPIIFETIEDKLSYNGTIQSFFGRNTSVKMICCCSKDQAAVLIIDANNVGSVWIRTLGDKGEASMEKQITGIRWERYFKTWLQCPVYYKNQKQCITMITCGKTHCAALTAAGDVFTCIFPNSDDVPADLPTWMISGNLAALAFEGGDCQRALQTIVDDMDVELRYKTDCNPMAASFGVTGGLRNPYLLNINTDGILAEQLAKKYKTKQNDLNENFKKQAAEHLYKQNDLSENFKKQTAEHFYKQNKMKNEAETHTREVADLENQVESRKMQGEQYKTRLQNAKQALEEAQNLHNEAVHAHSQHETELNRLNHELNAKVNGTKSVHTDTGSTNPLHYQGRDNRSIASSKTPSKGLRERISKFVNGKPTGAENELHFEDIAHFSASRENRCTYI